MQPYDDQTLRGDNRNVVFAGGIGITPIMAMITESRRRRADLRLHYGTRSPEETAFLDDIAILAA